MTDPELIPEAKAFAPETNEAGLKMAGNPTDSNGLPGQKGQTRRHAMDDGLPLPESPAG